MEITIARDDSKQEVCLTTISLSHDSKDKISLFRCISCGSSISQYGGTVVKIYPILEPCLDVLVINKCHDCGALYTFQTRISNSHTTKVILFANPLFGLQTFRCYTCRKELLKYDSKHIVDLVSLKEITLPHQLTCDCGSSYLFSDLL
jgi:uncharacterized protein with PIN domain